jgi:hypothetical protein
MPNEALARRIYSLQNKIVRDLNDAHIFLEQVEPLLAEARAAFEKSKSKSDRRYYVPSVDRRKYAKRTDHELKEIYNYFSSNGLYEAFLVTAVSQFESFLADVLITFLNHYPLRIAEVVQGVPACPNIPPRDLMAAPDKDQLVQRVLSDHVGNVFRQRPSLYMAYAVKLLSIKNDPSFADFYEVAATRDLVVHNNRVINNLYLDKAEKKARGAIGTKVPVDKDYYSGALAALKKVSGAIKHDIEKKYGAGGEDEV